MKTRYFAVNQFGEIFDGPYRSKRAALALIPTNLRDRVFVIPVKTDGSGRPRPDSQGAEDCEGEGVVYISVCGEA